MENQEDITIGEISSDAEHAALMRGLIYGLLISIAVFWIPLGLLLWWVLK
jgi:hypothetical protein